MTATQQVSKLTLNTVLYRLFSKPSIVLIGGTWKTGKTDFSLLLSEKLLKTEYYLQGPKNNFLPFTLVNEVASNIDTNGVYPQITDLVSLRDWLYGSSKRKLYIFDEASEHIPCTRAMSSKSVGIKAIIPQVSKAHGRMIVVGHNLMKIDKEMLNETWCKGIFFKWALKNATIISNLLPRPFDIANIPPTSIKFDPYILAPFTERPSASVFFKDEEKQLLWKWCNGVSAKELGLHPMQIHRKVVLFVKRMLENDTHTSQT